MHVHVDLCMHVCMFACIFMCIYVWVYFSMYLGTYGPCIMNELGMIWAHIQRT